AEKHDTGTTYAFDNDLLQFGDRDFDYTGGFAVTLAGLRAAQWPISLDRAAGWLEPLVPLGELDRSPRFILHALQLGLVAFTPDDLNVAEPMTDDRPYASLL